MRYNPISGRFELPAGSASVDGTAINPSSIGATTPGPATFTSVVVHDPSTVAEYGSLTGDTVRIKVGTHTCINATPDVVAIGAAAFGFGLTGPSPLVYFVADTDIWEQRRGTNAQESRLYGTYTSSTVYERLSSKYDSGSAAFVIGTEKGASGGSARNLQIRTDGTLRATFSASGVTANAFNGDYLVLSNTTYLQSTAAGRILLDNNTSPGNFDRLQFGGTTASYPSLKRSGTSLIARLANDSADAPIRASRLNLSDLPTSASGLSAGDIWNDSGTLKIV